MTSSEPRTDNQISICEVRLATSDVHRPLPGRDHYKPFGRKHGQSVEWASVSLKILLPGQMTYPCDQRVKSRIIQDRGECCMRYEGPNIRFSRKGGDLIHGTFQ